MSPIDTSPATSPKRNGIVRAVLNSMWGYWLSLLALSFCIAAGIYFIWLRGHL